MIFDVMFCGVLKCVATSSDVVYIVLLFVMWRSVLG